MTDLDILKGKRLLAVDDEPDILEIVTEVLSDSEVITAGDFEGANELIATERFDLAILDIMGVDGFTLLKACVKNKIPAAMLTAHAVNVESLNQAVKSGAVSFLPKEELVRLPELVAEILGELEQGRSHWQKLFKRFGPFFKEKLGVVWEDIEKPPYPPTFY